MTHTQFLSKRTAEAAKIAQSMLAGTVGIIEGSRILAAVRRDLCDDDFDPDFLPFVAIDSQTDHLPVGDQRRHWDPRALVDKASEIARAESVHREDALVACKRLIKRFERDV